jgi:hypothetical protein
MHCTTKKKTFYNSSDSGTVRLSTQICFGSVKTKQLDLVKLTLLTSGSVALSMGTGQATWKTPSQPATAVTSTSGSSMSALNRRKFSAAPSSRPSILGSPEMASAGIDQEQRRSGGVLGNGYGGVLRLGLVWLISFRSGLI